MAQRKSQVVSIAGFGARTPVGTTAIASAAAVRAAVAVFAQHPYMIDKAGDLMVVARDALLSEAALGAERFVDLGLPAALEAAAPLAGKREAIQVLIGLPAERPGLPHGVRELLVKGFQDVFRDHITLGAIDTFAFSHSGGLMALEEGISRVASGAASVCLVGGIDSYMEPETLEWLDEHDRLHSETNSWGFIPGEGAGFLLLCSKDVAERSGLTVLGEVLATASERESNVITNPDAVCVGEGLTRAFRNVLSSLPAACKVDFMICDMNGEPYRADEFGYTIVRTSERFRDANDFLTPVDCWGDVGAASGPLFIMLALVAQLKDYAKGPHTLVWTSSDAGQRSAALIQTGKRLKGE